MDKVTCKICGEDIGSLPSVNCERCETPHHRDCWEFNQGCSVFACNPSTGTGRRAPTGKGFLFSKDPIQQRDNLRGLVATLGILLCLVGGAHYAWPLIHPCQGKVPCDAGPVIRPMNQAEVGDRAPDFTISDLDGNEVTFSQLRKGRVAVLSFWRANCPDCMPHVPGWAKVYDRLSENSSLVLVNVAASARDVPETKKFCQENRIGGHVLMDTHNRAVPLYHLGTISALVVDSEGVIRYRGSQAGASAEKVEAAVKSLL